MSPGDFGGNLSTEVSSSGREPGSMSVTAKREEIATTPLFDPPIDPWAGAEEFIDGPECVIVKEGTEYPPFPHQRRAFLAVIDGLERGLTSLTYVMPTGTGKTALASYIARFLTTRLGWRGLALAHLGELLKQAQKSFRLVGVESAIEKAEMDAWEEIEESRQSLAIGKRDIRMVVGSRQTMARKRLTKRDRDYFDFIWADECHHVLSSQNMSIIGHFRKAIIIGATATDYRLKEQEDIYDVFQERVFEYRLDEALADGMICNPIQRKVPGVRLDLSNIRLKKGDFDDKQLGERLMVWLNPLANAIREQLAGRKILGFVPNVKVAYAIADILRDIGIEAKAVDGDSPDRHVIAEQFARDEFRCLFNVGLYTEGYDEPTIDAIAQFRPTKSRGLLTQMVGRGLRRGKENCLILDPSWNLNDLDITSLADIFAKPGTEPEAIKLARKLMSQENGPDDPVKALEEAQLELKRIEEEKLARPNDKLKVRGFKAPTQREFADYQIVQPTTKRVPPAKVHQWPWGAKDVPCTPRQSQALERMGVPSILASSLSKAQAGLTLRDLAARNQAGLARFKQVEFLVDRGIPRKEAEALKVNKASELITDFHRWDSHAR